MERQTVLAAMCSVLFLGVLAFQDGEKEANGYPVVDVNENPLITPIPETTVVEVEEIGETEVTVLVSHQKGDSAAGDCGNAGNQGKRFAPIRNTFSRVQGRVQSRRSSGNRWYPGKNLGWLFGGRR